MVEKLGEYEKRRLANIRQNEKVLASLELPTLTSFTSTPKPNKDTKTFKARQKPVKGSGLELVMPRRHSARLEQQKLHGTKTFSLFTEPYVELVTRRGKIPPISKSTQHIGPIPFAPEGGATEEFTHLMTSTILKTCQRPTEEEMTPLLSGSLQYQIENQFSIAKVVEERIYSMAVHPTVDKLIVSAGSKSGALGIWDATMAWQSSDREEARRTFHFRPHTAAITSQKYHPQNAAQLFLSSYDGTIRCMDIVKGEFTELYRADDEQLITNLDHNHNGTVLYFADTDGFLSLMDIREALRPAPFQLHQKKAGGLSLSPVDENLLASSSLDDTICLWDLRMLQPEDSKPLLRLAYKRAVTAVQFHPAIRDVLVSTCYDDTIRIHRGLLSPSHPPELAILHNNQTGRWITPFRAIWDPKSRDPTHSHVLVGDMNRGIDLIDMTTGLVSTSCSELLTAQPAVNALHPRLDLVLSGTAGGKCILWKRS